MYAIVEIAGQQFKVQKDRKLYVHRLEGNEGDSVSFDRVLLLDTGGEVAIGAPAVEGASISAEIVRHLKGEKVIVFKKKRRKGYKKKNGHRQYLTQIRIQDILTSGAAPKKAAAKKSVPKAESEGSEPVEEN